MRQSKSELPPAHNSNVPNSPAKDIHTGGLPIHTCAGQEYQDVHLAGWRGGRNGPVNTCLSSAAARAARGQYEGARALGHHHHDAWCSLSLLSWCRGTRGRRGGCGHGRLHTAGEVFHIALKAIHGNSVGDLQAVCTHRVWSNAGGQQKACSTKPCNARGSWKGNKCAPVQCATHTSEPSV